jgi:Raf kinase inhibitor-like YbhB/YbcL family protein
LELTSSAFRNGEPVPVRHTCDGEDVSPALAWDDVPTAAHELALIVDDPDAPGRVFTHWLAWGIRPGSGRLGEGEAAPGEGRNDFGAAGYRGPCPPVGHGPHRYVFTVHALEESLQLADGASRRDLERALEGRVIATAELVGTYERV